MKNNSTSLIKHKTIFWIIASMTFVFLVTAASILQYANTLTIDAQSQTLKLAAGNKKLELNNFFNSAENTIKGFENYILETIDEEQLLKDASYYEQYMAELTEVLSNVTLLHKGNVCTYFRMNIEKYGPSAGIFLTGGYQKSFVSIRTTDLSKFSPTDTEHVGWYYLPLWKKAPVWTPPYENLSLGQKMISYSVPVYKNNNFLGVVGIDYSYATIDDMIRSLDLESSTSLLIGTEGNLIHVNSQEDLSKAIDRSAQLSIILDQFENNPEKQFQSFNWDGIRHFGILEKLDNGMYYLASVSSSVLYKPLYSLIISLAAALLVIIIFTALIIRYTLKTIISPLRVISKTTNRLARGELYVDIPYQSANEIGSIANNIRLMTTQLKEYIEYIREQNKKEREAKEAALTESQINAAASQAKSAFLANMSHEIRTPINAVLGMDEMILRESKDKTILGYATNIKIAGSNLLSIVNDVLDFSKIEAGKMELLPDIYEVSSLIIDLVNMTRERAQNKGLKYELNINPTLPKTLYGDSVRIKQCILNLLTNAIKYTKEGSINFNIDYEKQNDTSLLLTVHVIDTGCGIKKEDMEKLFAPFERIEEEKNRTIEGSGLGMSIVRRLLDMMNSKLNVESTYGKGSDFSFTIEQQVTDWTAAGDLTEAYEESINQMANYKEKLYAPKAKLLFVDDTAMNLEVIKGLLKNTGITLDTVLSGKEALEAVKKNKYDILFIDHRMPDMDGIETLHTMKELKENLSFGQPCIALTANAISGVKKMYLNEGFDDYLSKPVNPAKLEEMICKYLPADYIETPPESEAQETVEPSDFIQKLKKIEGIDSIAALTNCGSEELLHTTIKQYHASIDEKALELQQYFEAEDWNNYGIKVHALKSTSRLIGAMELSKLAEHLEECANNNTVEELQTNHKPLLDKYLSFKHKLEPLLENISEATEKIEISQEELSEKITLMMACADAFDIDGLDSLVSELSSVKLPLDFSQKFDKIRTSIENVDFQELRNLLSEGSIN